MKLIAQICFSAIVALCLPMTFHARRATQPSSITSVLMKSIIFSVTAERLWIRYFKQILLTLKVGDGEDNNVYQ